MHLQSGCSANSNRITDTLFRLHANLLYLYNQTFMTKCLHCHLQVIRSDLLCLDITALYRPICMSYCGNNVGLSTCAGDATLQQGSTMDGKIEIYHLTVQTLQVWQVVVPKSAASDGTDWWTLQYSVRQSWWASLCSEKFAAVCKAGGDRWWLVEVCLPWDIWWWEVACKS